MTISCPRPSTNQHANKDGQVFLVNVLLNREELAGNIFTQEIPLVKKMVLSVLESDQNSHSE